ncbi:MAG: Uma2 family endonuclease [Anaerolineae bacterium]|nr:Uma2 family endonuclease [Gloeobacterales cyanobacterium ES-bin-313]
MPPKSTIFGTLSGDLTEKAAKSLALAREETRRLSLQFVGTEHLLLGILGEGTSAGATLLKAAGLSIEHTRNVVERKFGRGSGVIGVEMPFTPRARYAWEIGFVESEDRKHSKMYAEHILFGIIRESLMAGTRGGGCSHILKSYDIDIRDLEKQVVECLVRLSQPSVLVETPIQLPTLVEKLVPPAVIAERVPEKPVISQMREAAPEKLVTSAPVELVTEKPAVSVPPIATTSTPILEKLDWPPNTLCAGVARARLSASLLAYVDQEQLGQVATSSPISLESGDILSLDVLYISRERLKKSKSTPIPELAVLIAEQSSQLPILRAKLQILLASGTEVGLLITPSERTVTVCGATEQVLAEHESLQLPSLLPGYALTIKNLWLPTE